jgi:hypothetical protein
MLTVHIKLSNKLLFPKCSNVYLKSGNPDKSLQEEYMSVLILTDYRGCTIHLKVLFLNFPRIFEENYEELQ